jgi:D-alanyl-D-alanine carboxypeptidase
LGAGISPAEARHHRVSVRHARQYAVLATRSRGRHASTSLSLPTHYPANFAALVVDANTGRTLYSVNENELRHPASLTKVMTLYLLFEQLEKGRLRLDSEIPISAHAASMPPTKLGLRPGSSITVENAIKAIVTQSANDMAVAVAEALGGDEDGFARMMTEKAHALGMAGTHYANASGLPNPEQITTAHDLIILGRAIQQRFPQYYAYFSTQQFRYAGRVMHNHDHLLGRIAGMDGIKTGFTNASGYNLLASVRRGGRHLVAVVLGGTSWVSRDRIMTGLIDRYFDEVSDEHGGPAVAETAPDDGAARVGVVKPERMEPKPLPGAPASASDKPRPAFVSGTPKSGDEDRSTAGAIASNRRGALEGSTRAHAVADSSARSSSTATPSALHWVVGPAGVTPKSEKSSAQRTAAETKVAKADESESDAGSVALGRSAPTHAGVMIQIGATDDAEKANALLARARSENHALLAGAQPFTEKVQKGDSTLYRARFAGLGADRAEAACKKLKRAGFACFTTRN